MSAYLSVGSSSSASSGSSTKYTTKIDEVSASITYIGKALPGTLTSAASWSIQKLTTTGGSLDVVYSDAGNFSQIWDDRASLSYP